MSQQFSNVARALLTAPLGLADTTLSIEVSKADLFPTADTGVGAVPAQATSWFKVVANRASDGAIEVIYVRTRAAGSGEMSNLLRGREGTTPMSLPAGSVIGLRLTALDIAGMASLRQDDNTFTGTNTFTGQTNLDGPVAVGGAASFSQEAEFAGGIANPGMFIRNPRVITANATIAADENAMSIGPVEIADGVDVILDGEWSIV